VKKPPAFQFYPKDWRTSPTVLRMSAKDRGVYIDLLAASWDSEEPGTLPLPVEIAARCAGLDVRLVTNFLHKFETCFLQLNGKLVNEKLHNQWLNLQERQRVLSDAAKQTNEKRWGKPSPSESPSGRSSSSSSTAYKSKNPTYLPAQTASREGSGLHEVLVELNGRGSIVVHKPPKRRLWTQAEKDSLIGSSAQDYISFFKRKGFAAQIVPSEPKGETH
jgi:hypothetical protein